MFEPYNKEQLDALGSEGSAEYLHAGTTLVINPTAGIEADFNPQVHKGLIRKYDNKTHMRLFVVDHGTAERAEFEACLHGIPGYADWTIEYSETPLKTLRPAPERLKVLEEHYTVPETSDPSLITIAELPGFTKKQFNTLSNLMTRELTISGVALRWDGSVTKLNALQTLRDATKVTIIADEVLIALPLDWKGATVEIFARRLVFRDNGSISTTPQPYPPEVHAFAENRDADGRPLDPADKTKIKSADGRAGEAGGDIRLFIKELDTGGTTTSRLISHGSAGEKGEKGGLLPFPGLKATPPTVKDADPVSLEAVADQIKNDANSTSSINALDYWNFPSDRREGYILGDLNGGLKGRNYFAERRVTDVRLLMNFQHGIYEKLTVVRIPQNKKETMDQQVTDPIRGGVHNKLGHEVPISSSSTGDRRLPSNGEDAYPSGRSGKGGDAGGIYAAAPFVPSVSPVVSALGGHSPMSDPVDGGPRGKPEQAIFVDLLITQYFWLANRDPEVHYHEYKTSPGNGCTGSNSASGADKPNVSSTLLSETGQAVPIEESAWLEPRLIRAVTSYAKVAFRNGQREQARKVLEPYWEALKAKGNVGALAGPKHALDSVVDCLEQNLDLYGYPPGWVPRFSADSYLQTYLADRKFSYRFCYVMSKAAKLMESMQHAGQMLTVIAQQGEATVVRLQTDLFEAYKRYDAVRDELDKAHQTVKAAEQQMNDLKTLAESDALLKQANAATVKGLFSIAGAVLSAIPVYQPALAGLGTVIQGVGDLVADQGDDPPNAADYVAQIAGTVATTLDKNAVTFKSQFDDRLKDKYAAALGAHKEEDDLAASIAKLQGSITTQQKVVDRDTDEAHDAVQDDKTLAPLLQKGSTVSAGGTNPPPTSEALRRQLAEYDALITDLKDFVPGQSALANELATVRKQNLIAARSKLRAQLADSQLQADAIARDDKKTAAEKKAAADRKTTLETAQKTLDDLLEKRDQKQAEAAVADANKKFGSALEGVQRMAQGAASIAGALSAMSKKIKPDDPAVVALRDKLLKSRFQKEYKQILAAVDKAKDQLSTATSQLQASNQNVRALSGDLASALQSTIDVGRNRQAMALGCDAGLKGSIEEMQRQATERMDFYLYLFRKAYLYEYCKPIGDQMANINTFVTGLDTWIQTNKIGAPAGGGPKPVADSAGLLSVFAEMKDDDLANAGNDALKNTLNQLAKNIVDHRDKVGGVSDNNYPLELTPTMLKKLSTTGELDLEEVAMLIPDLYRPPKAGQRNFFDENPLIRIASVTIPSESLAFKVKAGTTRKPVRLDLTFGREFVLRNGTDYFMFRLGSADAPSRYGVVISGFSQLPNAGGLWTATATPDKRLNVDELFTTATSESGKVPEYKEMSPSILTSMNIAVTLGRDQIESFERLTLLLKLQVN